MAGNIKGITVEIGGDTTKLSKALNDVNKESKSLQGELKGIDSLLKFNPSNTELLAQKQKVLSESIEATKNKLQTLKDVEEQVKQQFANGDIGEAEFRDFQREIEATEQKVKKLEDQMKEFGSVSAQQIAAAGEKVKETGGKIESAGKAFAPVSAAAAAVGTASVAAFKDIDKGYDIIVKATGATGDALDDLKNTAKEVFGSMPVEMDVVGGAIGEINTRFGATGDTLKNLTTDFLQFSEITGQEVVSAVGNVDKIMEAWNIDASQTKNLLGLIAGKAQETGISVDTLENTVLENNSTFKEMGLTLEQSIGLMAQFEANGVNSQTALAGLKKAVKNATDEGLTLDEALSQTIDSIKNAGSETEALTIATDLFGNKGAPEMVRAIKEGRLSLDDINVSMSNYSDTVSTTFEATQDPVDKVKTAFNNLKIVGAELGESILSALTPAIEKVGEAAKKLADWFSGLSEGTKQIIVVITGIIAAIGPALIIIGKLTTAVGSIMTMAPKIQGAFTAIQGALAGLSAPVMAVIAVIGVLVAAFATLWNTNEEFRNKITEIWNGITETLSGFFQGIVDRLNDLGFNFSSITDVLKAVWEGFCNFLAPIFEGAFSIISTVLSSVCDVLTGILDIFIGLFTGNWEQCWNGIKEIFGGVWDAISGIFTAVLDTLGALFQPWTDAIHNILSSAWESIKNTTTTIWNGIKDGISAVWEGIKNISSTAGDVLHNAINACWEAIKNITNTVWEDIKNIISTVWDGIKTGVEAVINSIKTIIENIWNVIKALLSGDMENIKSTVSGAWENIKNSISNTVNTIFSTVKNVFSSIWGTIKSTMSEIYNNIVNVFGSLPKKMLEIGSNIVSGIWNGISSGWQWLKNKVADLANSLIDGVKDILGIHSPSKAFADKVGKWIPAGIGQGILDNSEAMYNPLDQLINNAIDGAEVERNISVAYNAEAAASDSARYDSILKKLDAILLKTGNDIYLDGKTLVGGIKSRMDETLAGRTTLKARGI